MWLVLNIIFSAIGSAYLLYGRRQYDVPFLVAGFVLCIYPWFVSNTTITAIIGVIVTAAPFVLARLE